MRTELYQPGYRLNAGVLDFMSKTSFIFSFMLRDQQIEFSAFHVTTLCLVP